MKVYEIDGIVPVVDPTAYVHPSAVLIGDVVVGPGVYIGPCASLRGDFGRLFIRAGANVQDCCVMHGFPGSDTIVEENGHVGHGAILHGCTIKRDALVGMNATVMDGAVVGESAFVAAMAFVRAGFAVPPRTLVGGIPAKIMRDLTDREIEWKRSGTRDYQNLTLRCLATFEERDALEAPEPGRQRLSLKGVSEPLYKTR